MNSLNKTKSNKPSQSIKKILQKQILFYLLYLLLFWIFIPSGLSLSPIYKIIPPLITITITLSTDILRSRVGDRFFQKIYSTLYYLFVTQAVLLLVVLYLLSHVAQ